jgi:uncharacterized membrane protein YeaQ/YmgE (transglycosylase-associated protein family)
MDLLTFLIYLFVGGLIVGALARLFIPGTGGMGILRTVAAGVLGSFVAGLISWYLIAKEEPWVGFVLAVLCAMVFVFLMRPRPTLINRYR